jgi:GNAT superfamily N-acetyltransferase
MTISSKRIDQPSLFSDDRVELRAVAYDSPVARSLVAAAQRDQVERYGAADQTPVRPEQFSSPHGLFLIAFVHDKPIACGGYRVWDDGITAEIKRMYVTSQARRRGVARAMLAAVENAAAEAGCTRVVLDCGPGSPEAIELWEAAGYQRIPGFSGYRHDAGNRAYGKNLATRRPNDQQGIDSNAQ